MTGGAEDIEGGSNSFRLPKGGLWKKCWARRGGVGGGLRKFVYFKVNRTGGWGS